ncbi:MAG: thioredoxin family protein [Haloarculaceae archaeon]
MTGDTPDRPRSLADRDDLDELVEAHDRVLVEFYTDGCGVCASMEPVLSGVARTTDVVVATANPRDDPVLVEEYDVRSVPKLLLFEDGDLVDARADGFVGVDELRSFVGAD